MWKFEPGPVRACWLFQVLSNGTVDVVYDTVGEAGTGDRAMSLMRRGAQLCTWAVMRGS